VAAMVATAGPSPAAPHPPPSFSFPFLPFFTSPQQRAATVAVRDGELVKRLSLGRPEEVAAPPHGSLPACALARAERAAIKWPCGGAPSPRAHEERRRWGFFPHAGGGDGGE
jgi:hypothetical protein